MDVRKDQAPRLASRSLDGFVVPSQQPRPVHRNEPLQPAEPEPAHAQTYKTPQSTSIDLSLPDERPTLSTRRGWPFGRKRRPGKERLRRHLLRRRIIIGTVAVLLLSVVGLGAYFGWKIFSNASKIFKGNVFGAVTSIIAPDKQLKTDAYGNTNVLALGTSESDPNHPGAQLTDSMMIISINKAKKTAFLMSIPRDLWVQYDTPCSAGYSGKINAVYECSLGSANGGIANNNNDETTAENAAGSKVSSVFGIDINYVVHLNLAVVQKVVDAVGGIDVVINSPDPRGILDRNFDWRCNYKCYLVKYPNGPAHLDGTHAMWLVQARNDAGGYGLPRGNFDRENSQRMVLIALEKKALSVGFLANPLNVTNLLDALGSNVHTTIDTSEIKSFIDIAKSIPSSNITSFDIVNDAPDILTTGTGPDGSSIVRPVAGLINYTGLQSLSTKLLNGQGGLIAEAAKVDVLNGSGVTGAAAQEATVLEQAGLTIGTVDSAPASYTSTDKYTLYDVSNGAKPQTLAALKQALGVNTVQTKLPAGVTSSSSFVVILGKPAQSTTAGN